MHAHSISLSLCVRVLSAYFGLIRHGSVYCSPLFNIGICPKCRRFINFSECLRFIFIFIRLECFKLWFWKMNLLSRNFTSKYFGSIFIIRKISHVSAAQKCCASTICEEWSEQQSESQHLISIVLNVRNERHSILWFTVCALNVQLFKNLMD